MSPSAPSLYELVSVDAFRSTSRMVRSVHPLFAPVFDSACRPLSGGEGVTVHPALVVSERKIPSGAGGGRADVEACGENRGASTASTSASTSAWTSVVGGGEDTAALPGVSSADTGHPDIPSALVVNCPVVGDDLEGVSPFTLFTSSARRGSCVGTPPDCRPRSGPWARLKWLREITEVE